MSEIADKEPDATIVTDLVYDRNRIEQKSWNFCFDVLVPISKVVFMSQIIIILILVSFCIYKHSLKHYGFPYCLVKLGTCYQTH